MRRLSISLPVYGDTSMSKLQQMARWAEDAGFEAAWAYEICRNPYLTLAATALSTSRIKLGTAIAIAFSRSPFVTANAAADVDELSQGRMLLGIAPGEEQHLIALHNADFSKPIPRMREYIEALRVIWDSLASGQLTSYEGTFYQLKLDERLRRPLIRKRIPIYLAAMQPKMMQLAAEVADGLLGFWYSLRYLKEVVQPNLAIGANRRSSDLSALDLCSYIVCCVSKDRAEAIRRARIQVGFYTFLHSSDGIVRYHRMEKEQLAIRAAMAQEGPQALERVTDDKLVETFSISGTPDECRRKLESYSDVVPLPLLHPPYFDPLTPEETEDAFRGILETFGS